MERQEEQKLNTIDIESIELDLGPDVKVDEQTKRRLKIAEAIKRLASTLPPEEVVYTLRPTIFDPEFAQDGLMVVFLAGTAIATGKKDCLQVPERTRKILDALGIPYCILTMQELDNLPFA